MIEIKPYSDSDSKKWDEYVLRHPDGTLFHLSSWKVIIERTFQHKSHYYMALKEKNIVGILPLFHIKSALFGNYLVSIPFAEVGGILTDYKEVTNSLMEKAEQIAQTINCDYMEFRNIKPIEGMKTKSLYFNFKKQISPNNDENLKAIPRKARRMVRQGIKKGLESQFGNHLLPVFYELIATNFHRLGTPIFPKKFFKNFIEEFSENSSILMVHNTEGKAIAGVLSFYYKDTIMPYYAGSLFEFRQLAPNDFMYWELMRNGAAKGYKFFDFGRSKVNTGSYDFKRHWGFEPVQLHYQYKLTGIDELPNLSPANPKYQKKIEIWRKLPFWATKLIGPQIARYLA